MKEKNMENNLKEEEVERVVGGIRIRGKESANVGGIIAKDNPEKFTFGARKIIDEAGIGGGGCKDD